MTRKTNRMVEGWKLYQKGNVELIHEDEELLQFQVKSKKQIYLCDMDLKEGTVRCNPCQDYEYRHQYANSTMGLDGSFICKHLWSCFFKLGEIRGIGKQVNLIDILEPALTVSSIKGEWRK